MDDHRAWMRDLFHTGKYSDIDLISNNQIYEAHRSVVCFMSPVIYRSCEFNTAKLGRVESEPNKSDHGTAKASFSFGDDDPEAVDCLVQFLYLWDYEVASPLSDDVLDRDESREDTDYSPLPDDNVTALEARQLLLHSKVFTLAHMKRLGSNGDLVIC
ncbi:uncharacterized protein FIESC28_03106 [Fusarium coffeatum]|uniref:BTB domain-containing protein n=1 Tax=Fusarium coffeatum TaxID=231269 RepID=A0A366S456_9HYPO|nr:uncharacterized protein FIESC28_03106 [Fusarium coffeatum]RBR24107.1 hypothetical protein FIESC28_03106 [Fusarium coffeatum]